MLWKCCTQCASKFGKCSSGHRPGKGQFSFHSQKMFKLLHNCTHLTCYNAQNSPSQASTVYTNCELSDVQAGFRNGRGTRDPIADICWIIKKAREFQKKTSTSALLTMPKPLTVWITTNCEKLWKRWEYQSTWPASWKICLQVKKQQLELDMEQQTVSKSGK